MKSTFDVLKDHCGKTIIKIEEDNADIVITFNDHSQMVLEDRYCNTCAGYRVKGSEED